MPRVDLPSFLPFRLNRLAAEISDRLSAIYSERFRLDIPEWRVLATLADGKEWTAQAIVASTRTHKSTISRAVQSLEMRGLVKRNQSPADGRALSIALTMEGDALMAELAPLALQFESDLLGSLTTMDRRSVETGVEALERQLGLAGRDPAD